LADSFKLNVDSGKISEEAGIPFQGGSNSEDKDKNSVEGGLAKERVHNLKVNQKPNGVHDDHSVQKGDSYMTLSGHRAGEAAIVYEHGADIEALMPKLRRSDYYTQPRIQELAAKERAEPGFCRHVKDFVVGRHGYGSIKFLGETDVRRLDLEALVQFNNREVIVYMDDSKKPPIGQGLNKPAEVTLLNIKCFDKKTGQQYTEGPKIEKYREMLKRKAEDQGAEFVSYDPIKGEWKFRVNHFWLQAGRWRWLGYLFCPNMLTRKCPHQCVSYLILGEDVCIIMQQYGLSWKRIDFVFSFLV
jgi:nuclear pore complex protein Nup98-Nup96